MCLVSYNKLESVEEIFHYNMYSFQTEDLHKISRRIKLYTQVQNVDVYKNYSTKYVNFMQGFIEV